MNTICKRRRLIYREETVNNSCCQMLMVICMTHNLLENYFNLNPCAVNDCVRFV